MNIIEGETEKDKNEYEWIPPSPSSVSHPTGLHIMNSLSRKLERFVTKDGSRHLKWYMDGPVVYGPSHIGHARTYMTFDIMRRILNDYLKYDVTLVMNVTDIDDKIINRSLEENITFSQLAHRCEADFFKDMALLDVEPPTITMRNSDCIRKIVNFIHQIEQKGLAYQSHSSVYFDVEKFSSMSGNYYCKLSPERRNNQKDLIIESFNITEKRNVTDFVLWRKSKPNEPSFYSPWGPGRPGWHAESSAIACDVFKNIFYDETVDIYSGGKDFKFPHHDCQLALSEAAFPSCNQWVNYFVHSGNLTIDGVHKDDPITIREVLERYSARQLRFYFLLHKYNEDANYTEYDFFIATNTEEQFSVFFQNCRAMLCGDKATNSPQNVDSQAYFVLNTLQDYKNRVRSFLLDDFDTPGAMSVLLEIIKTVTVYTTNNPNIVYVVIRNCALYVTEMFKIFGLIPHTTGIGFPLSSDEKKEEKNLMFPVVDAFMDFRAQVSDLAKGFNRHLDHDIIELVRNLRDDVMPSLGITIKDSVDGKSIWQFTGPENATGKK